jgi:predicted outer membrane repeat protein
VKNNASRGIGADNSTVSLTNCLVERNLSGGITAYGNSQLNLSGTTIRNNESSYTGGGISLNGSMAWFDPENRCNIYNNNADYGMDIAAVYMQDYIYLYLDTFSVMLPTDLYIYSLDYIYPDILHGRNQQVTADLYFSPQGFDENSGLTPEEPLKSISRGIRMFLPCYGTQHTFHLAPGEYSEENTGENMPLFLPGYLTLAGSGKESTVIQEINEEYMVMMLNRSRDTIRDLTLEGINRSSYGIRIENSSLHLENVDITNNDHGLSALGSCTLTTDSVTVSNNDCGLATYDAQVSLKNLVIKNNHCGVYTDDGKVFMENILVQENTVGITTYSGTATLKNLELEGNGLGLDAENTTLNMLHCEVSGNGSEGTAGGSLRNSNGLFVGNTWKDHHTNSSGGGIHMFSCNNITFINDHFEDNTTERYGGGVYCEGSNPFFAGCRFNGNMAASGGGIYCEGSNPVFAGCRFNGNMAASGGGIYFWNNSGLYLVGCLVENNMAEFGGGIYDNRETGYLSNTTIRNNHADQGGGIYYANTSMNEGYTWDDLSRCNIYLNSARFQGHDLYSYSTSLVHPVVIDSFTVSIPTDDFAWHTYNFSLDFLYGKCIPGNYDVYVSPSGDDGNSGFSPDDPLKTLTAAVYKGFPLDTLLPHRIYLDEGIYSPSLTGEKLPVEISSNVEIIGSGRESTIIDGEFQNRLFSTIDLYTESFSLKRLTLRNGLNDANYPDYFGGAIFCSAPRLNLEEVTIDSCRSYHGGAIFADSTDIYLADVSLLNNNSEGYGGALYTSDCECIYKNVEFLGNYSTHGGGGWFGTGTTLCRAENTVFGNNISDANGGAVYLYTGEGALSSLAMENNQARRGGAIAIYGSTFDLQNVVLSGNEAITEGGAIYSNNSKINLNLATFSGNTSPKGTNISANSTLPVVISNSIMPDDPLNKINLKKSELNVSYSDITGGDAAITLEGTNNLVSWLDGNIDTDPLFEGSGDFPLALSSSSPCIDAGNPDTTGMDLPMWDIIGNYRLWDGDNDGDTILDMGAYEFGSVGVGVDEPAVGGQRSAVSVYPNPTQGIVDFRLSMVDFRWVSLKVYDVHGREVVTVVDGNLPAGEHVVQWDASGLPAGVYVYQLRAKGLGQGAVGKIVKY